MFEREVLDLFKSMVVDSTTQRSFYVNAEHGYALDFTPNKAQLAVLEGYFKPLDVRTLFSVEERRNSDPEVLICKQILDYIATYGLNTPGVFNLEVSAGKIVTINFITGITRDVLNEKLQTILYANAPVKDANTVRKLVTYYCTVYNFDKVKNNELRVLLFDPVADTYSNGDDAVRYICYAATESALLIKSPEVIQDVKAFASQVTNSWLEVFLDNHKMVLAQVFNRHKPLILALKNARTRSIINEISRLSKKLHVPLMENPAKTFISRGLSGKDVSLDGISLRDKFKFLNILAVKAVQDPNEVYIIRNGKSHLEHNRRVFDIGAINSLQDRVLASLKEDLTLKLRGKKILLDKNVDYGLPISRKQTLGNLPFGTTIKVEGRKISTGIYWEDKWGATDLDLSAIDYDGHRTGWGQYSGYAKDAPVEFSGDVTRAPNGAMEFMTSSVDLSYDYGLLVNTYSGYTTGVGMELVIGTQTDNKWIVNPIVREKHTLPGRGAIIGFVKGKYFIVYAPAVAAQHTSSPKSAKIIQRAKSYFWTVRALLDACLIDYDLNRIEGKEYDFDLTYSNFSLDKLEELF